MKHCGEFAEIWNQKQAITDEADMVCRRLINLSKMTSDSGTRSATINVGCALFYAVTTYVSQETKFYPPTKHFFSSCIEMLGQV